MKNLSKIKKDTVVYGLATILERNVVPDRPVRFQIAGEFKRIPFLAQLSFGSLSFLFLFLQSDDFAGNMAQKLINVK